MLYETWMKIYCTQRPMLQRWKEQVQTVVPYFHSALPYQFDIFMLTKSGVISSSLPVNVVCECSLAFLSASSCDVLFSMKPSWIAFLINLIWQSDYRNKKYAKCEVCKEPSIETDHRKGLKKHFGFRLSKSSVLKTSVLLLRSVLKTLSAGEKNGVGELNSCH